MLIHALLEFFILMLLFAVAIVFDISFVYSLLNARPHLIDPLLS